jgi:hypothetical protein
LQTAARMCSVCSSLPGPRLSRRCGCTSTAQATSTLQTPSLHSGSPQHTRWRATKRVLGHSAGGHLHRESAPAAALALASCRVGCPLFDCPRSGGSVEPQCSAASAHALRWMRRPRSADAPVASTAHLPLQSMASECVRSAACMRASGCCVAAPEAPRSGVLRSRLGWLPAQRGRVHDAAVACQCATHSAAPIERRFVGTPHSVPTQSGLRCCTASRFHTIFSAASRSLEQPRCCAAISRAALLLRMLVLAHRMPCCTQGTLGCTMSHGMHAACKPGTAAFERLPALLTRLIEPLCCIHLTAAPRIHQQRPAQDGSPIRRLRITPPRLRT